MGKIVNTVLEKHNKDESFLKSKLEHELGHNLKNVLHGVNCILHHMENNNKIVLFSDSDQDFK